MHYIQKHILDTLRTVDTMNYTALNHDGIESGHFRYHLTQLVKDKYVDQVRRGLYRLTPAGKRLVDGLSEGRVNPMVMQKVITYTLLVDDTNLILLEKQKEPYLHLVNMVGGKLHLGETSVEAAVREVKEKTGVDCEKPELRGVFQVIVRQHEQVYTYAIVYVHYLSVSVSLFADAPVTVIDVDSLSAQPNLAPDFMSIYTRVRDVASGSVSTDVLLLDV